MCVFPRKETERDMTRVRYSERAFLTIESVCERESCLPTSKTDE